MAQSDNAQKKMAASTTSKETGSPDEYGMRQSIDHASLFTGDKDPNIEKMIQDRRMERVERSAGFCPCCGKPIQQSDNYCPGCGEKIDK
jgi:rubrerythrin